MKSSLIRLSLLTVAASAFAGTQVAPFSWDNTSVPPANTQIATVAPFNTALGTLTGVQINLTGHLIVGSTSVLNASTFQTANFFLILTGTHTVTINGFTIDNAINLTSPTVPIGPGVTVGLGPVSSALGGSLNGGLSGWTSGNIPVFFKFPGSLLVSASPQVTFQSSPVVTSDGIGNVTYTYTEARVPEAETYVAGLALVGLVGYGCFRRTRQA